MSASSVFAFSNAACCRIANVGSQASCRQTTSQMAAGAEGEASELRPLLSEVAIEELRFDCLQTYLLNATVLSNHGCLAPVQSAVMRCSPAERPLRSLRSSSSSTVSIDSD